MNRRKAIGSVMLGSAAVAVTARTAKAAEKSLESFAARWAASKTFTLAVANAMPAESYDFKPQKEMRSFGELVVHIGQANIFYLSRLAKTPPAQSMRSAKPDKDSATKYLNDVFDWCLGVINGATVADLDKVYPGPNNAPGMSGWDLVMNVFIHTAHHRGYADVYLREKGITPPTYAV